MITKQQVPARKHVKLNVNGIEEQTYTFQTFLRLKHNLSPTISLSITAVLQYQVSCLELKRIANPFSRFHTFKCFTIATMSLKFFSISQEKACRTFYFYMQKEKFQTSHHPGQSFLNTFKIFRVLLEIRYVTVNK